MPILVDTLSFRARFDNKEKILQILGISDTIFDWEDGVGFNGYPQAIYYAGIKIGFNGCKGFSCYVHMSGKGCRTWEDHTTLEGGWMTLLEYLKLEPDNYHFARLDLAYDDYTDTLNIERIDKYRRLRKYSTKTTFFTTVMGSEEIAYIGSPQSHTRLRIYNKKLERGYTEPEDLDGKPWYRCEFQFRDECATACVDALVTYQDPAKVFFGKLLDFIRFTTKPNIDSRHANRLNVSSWWLDFCQNYPRLKFFYEPGSEYNMSKLEKFCRFGAGSSVKTLIHAKGLSPYELYSYFTSDRIDLRQDQVELIRQKEFERGVNLLDSALYKVKKDEK